MQRLQSLKLCKEAVLIAIVRFLLCSGSNRFKVCYLVKVHNAVVSIALVWLLALQRLIKNCGGSSPYTEMKRRRTERANNFYKVVGIPGISDSAIQKVLDRLQSHTVDPDKGTHGRPHTRRFPALLRCVEETKEHGLCTVDLQKYISCLTEGRPEFLEFLKRHLLPVQVHEGHVPGIIYLDEVVPGNVLRPDNERRSFCCYFTFLPLRPFRQEAFWFPIAALRSVDVDTYTDGMPQIFSQILRGLLNSLAGLVLGDTLVVCEEMYFLGDEDALKKCVSHKGASGKRPCIKCGNVISKGSAVPGYVDITCSDAACLQPACDVEVLDMFSHLRDIRHNKSKLSEAEMLSGWKYAPTAWILDDALWSLLKPSHVVYDAMRNIWCNGMAAQEIGLFFTAVHDKASITRADLEEALKASSWKMTKSIQGYQGSAQALVNKHVLKLNSDYRGDANQTASLLPLLAYFTEITLCGVPELHLECQSLKALNNMANAVLQAKATPQNFDFIRYLQEDHLRAFQKSYGSDAVRPKHHYNLHVEEQLLRQKMVLDCWPTERKNKTFKLNLAPNLKKLQGFTKSLLLRWLEIDKDKIMRMRLPSTGITAELKEQVYKNVTFAQNLCHLAGTIMKDEVLIFDSKEAYLVTGAYKLSEQHLGCLVEILEPLDHGDNMSWSKWRKTYELRTLQIDMCINHLRSSWISANEDDTLLILR